MSALGREPVFTVRWGAASDTGRHRALNEDSYLAAPPVFVVADGMGGHARGEVASRRVVEAFESVAGKAWLGADQLFLTVERAGESVRLLAGEQVAPGSTLAGVALTHQHGLPCWLVFNIGDSRVYRLRGEAFEQISVDHSRVQELRDSGDEQAAAATGRNIITRALGGGSAVRPLADQWLLPAVAGDRMLICSDGVNSELTDRLISATLTASGDPQDAAQGLVDAAVGAGGRDNVTAVVVDAVTVQPVPGVEVLPWGDDTVGGAPDDDTIPDAAKPGHVAVEVETSHITGGDDDD